MSLGLGELILILLIAFVVVGPEDLPKVARGLARALKQIRVLFAGMKEELDMEGDLEDIRKEFDIKGNINEMKKNLDVDPELEEEIKDITRIRKEIMTKRR